MNPRFSPKFWTGREVERTCFYGEPTLFVDGGGSLMHLDDVIAKHTHIYVIARTWFAELKLKLEKLLGLGKKITVEIPVLFYANDIKEDLDYLRKQYLNSFCFVLKVSMESPDQGHFAIKVQSDKTYEKSIGLADNPPDLVFTVPSQAIINAKYQTLPYEYTNDVPGSLDDGTETEKALPQALPLGSKTKRR